MRILTLENKAFDLNELPEEVEADARFSVLDNSDPKNPDFFFLYNNFKMITGISHTNNG